MQNKTKHGQTLCGRYDGVLVERELLGIILNAEFREQHGDQVGGRAVPGRRASLMRDTVIKYPHVYVQQVRCAPR